MSSLQIDYDSVAEIYDLYVTADYDIAFFLSETANVEGPVLELTAGTGRLSLPLIQAGARLTCVDASQGMLDVLARKLKERGLHAELRCADACHLQPQTSFQLAILPFQSFMEIVGEERQRQVVRAVFACLTPGGRFVCTLHNPVVRRTQVDGVLRIVGRFPTQDGTLVVSGFEQGGCPIVTRLQFFEFFANDGQLRSKLLLPMEFAFVEKDHFESMARDAGFRVLELYGDYDRSAFDPMRSPVMIWVLQKGDAQASVAADAPLAARRLNASVGHYPAATPKEAIEMLNGGCFCGAIRYEAGGTPFHQTNCHCTICRRTTGAPFVAWFSVLRSEFRLIQGTPAKTRSSPRGMRTFCPHCGTQLTFEHDDASNEIDVTTCSLDAPEQLPPKDHTQTSTKLAWVKLADALPQYREARSKGDRDAQP